MTSRVAIEGLQVSQPLFNFIEQEVLPESGITSAHFWQSFAAIISDLTPVNKTLLAKREQLQTRIDQWHKSQKSPDFASYKQFLKDIDYLVDEPAPFEVSTQNVDAEIATMAGPQLVVPIMNARFALNAVNARWGSLYDALYGSDVISEEQGAEKVGRYNAVRGAKVISYVRDLLDKILPLKAGSHHQAVSYQLTESQVVVLLEDDSQTSFVDDKAFIGFTGTINTPASLMFKHNGLHIELCFDLQSTIGKQDKAGVSDVNLEAALTTIMDCEDSVAAVDAEDKVIAYRNWLGLMQGSLSEQVTKGDKSFERVMANDFTVQTLAGSETTIKRRSLMFVRNVGHLMSNGAIIDQQGNEVFEGIMDAMITSTIALRDVKQQNSLSNSQQGSIYIVKPKMHGPEEVAFANQLFERVEQALSLPENTIKMGIMDEERRTSANLRACIAAAKTRVVFINTGFLDRTGDEIHTSMHAGIMERKGDIKATKWISAYEDNNVDAGLSCGLSGKAQIGKGMWPIPDQMANMLTTKIGHVNAGANTAWVPSPTAAVLHALHYHQVDVFSKQAELSQRKAANLDDILTIPLAKAPSWSAQEIEQELDNNAQGILGYVVRWIDQGIGCSKVPDINNVGLMEDRATLRISSQHMANWLLHGVCSEEQIIASMKKMANVVDQQNSSDPHYTPMSDDFENNIAFNAALQLVLQGSHQPSGYTEPLLHEYRLRYKQSQQK